MLLSTTPTTEIVVPKWFFANEPEGLAVTGALDPEADPLGGVLHWQILPTLTLLTLYVNVLGYVPAASDASAGQRTRPLRAFKAPVVRLPEICGHRCAQVGYVLRAGAVAAAHQRSPRRARTRGAALDAR